MGLAGNFWFCVSDIFSVAKVFVWFFQRPEVVYEQESKSLDCLKAKSMCCNPFTQRTILVLSSKAWQVGTDQNIWELLSPVEPYKTIRYLCFNPLYFEGNLRPNFWFGKVPKPRAYPNHRKSWLDRLDSSHLTFVYMSCELSVIPQLPKFNQIMACLIFVV